MIKRLFITSAFILIVVRILPWPVSTGEFEKGIKLNPLKFLSHHIIRIMPNQSYTPQGDFTRFLKVENNTFFTIATAEIYMKNDDKDSDYSLEVQYLPWNVDSGIYIYLQSKPEIFLTDKLTGCYLAFKKNKIVHMNFQNYDEKDKLKTLSSYEGYYLLSPEDYRPKNDPSASATVLGIRVHGEWNFYYQVKRGNSIYSGELLMVDEKNKYGCKSVKLHEYSKSDFKAAYRNEPDDSARGIFSRRIPGFIQ